MSIIICHRCTTKVIDKTAIENTHLSDEDLELKTVTELIMFAQSSLEDGTPLFQDDSGLLVCARHLIMPEVS